MLNPEEVITAIKQNDPIKLAAAIKKHNLTIQDNRVVADPKYVEASAVYWDRMQLIKKILLNS